MIKYISLLFLLLITGCNSSPLKSDLELTMNTTFNTDFDYIDTIILVEADKKTKLTITEHESLKIIIDQLSTAKKVKDSNVESNPLGEIIVMTSIKGEQYNSKQKKAIIEIINIHPEHTKLRYNNTFYSVPVDIVSTIQNR